jgi:spoIIIJ-associated protein
MNSYERRIVHEAISTIEGVHTISEGEEPNRCVVIKKD